MKRRTFIGGLGSTVAWPVVARAQQAVVPVIGYLSPGSSMTTRPGPSRFLPDTSDWVMARVRTLRTSTT